METSQLATVGVTFIEDRNGRALVRLPNGSKTSIAYDALRSQTPLKMRWLNTIRTHTRTPGLSVLGHRQKRISPGSWAVTALDGSVTQHSTCQWAFKDAEPNQTRLPMCCNEFWHANGS